MTISVQDNILRCLKKFGAEVSQQDRHKRLTGMARPVFRTGVRWKEEEKPDTPAGS